MQIHRSPGFTKEEVQDDLKAFERRITRAVRYLEPKSYRWKFLLIISVLFVLFTGYGFITNLQIDSNFSILAALYENKVFALALIFLALLILTGAHNRADTSAIILSRNRLVLHEYNLSCNEKGKLIIKPKVM
eukprot:sb/3474878/